MFRHIVRFALCLARRKRKYLELACGPGQYHFVLHYFLPGTFVFRYVLTGLFFLYQHLRLGAMVKAQAGGKAGYNSFIKTAKAIGFYYYHLDNYFWFCCQEHSSFITGNVSRSGSVSIHRYIHCRVQRCRQRLACKTHSGKLGAVGTRRSHLRVCVRGKACAFYFARIRRSVYYCNVWIDRMDKAV